MVKASDRKAIDILGVKIDTLTPSQSIDIMAQFITSRQTGSLVIVKPYVEFMTKAYRDKKVRRLLNQADLKLADGVSLQWAASFLYGQPQVKPTILKLAKSLFVDIQNRSWREQVIQQRGAGVDATKQLLMRAAQEKWRVGIVSGQSSEAETKKNNISRMFPGLNLVDVWPGYFDSDQEKDMVENIKSSRLDILFVARGFPRQEYFIDHYRSTGLGRVLIGEGGSFDYDQLGGKLKRAPQGWRRLGLEWLWRLFLQPSRFGRMLSVPQFVWLVYDQARQQK